MATAEPLPPVSRSFFAATGAADPLAAGDRGVCRVVISVAIFQGKGRGLGVLRILLTFPDFFVQMKGRRKTRGWDRPCPRQQQRRKGRAETGEGKDRRPIFQIEEGGGGLYKSEGEREGRTNEGESVTAEES
jgi:hypothetical protein